MARILVIDDEETIRKVFNRYLSSCGHTVDCAANGKEGLRLMEAEPPDLVITDVMMPETDGLEVVIAMHDRKINVPVIAISGGMHAAPLDFLPIIKKFGAYKVFYKPIKMEELITAIDELLPEIPHTNIK